MDWIERVFGVSPDLGSGSIELAIAIAVGAALAFTFLRVVGLRRSRGSRRQHR